MRRPVAFSRYAGALTRFQPWPIVERFLKEQEDGAIGADVGCGNGKYLAVNDRVFIVGSDRYVCAVSLLLLGFFVCIVKMREKGGTALTTV